MRDTRSRFIPYRTVLFFVLLACVIVEGIFLHRANLKLQDTNQQLMSTQQQLQTVQTSFDTESSISDANVLAALGKLTTLPAGENPTIATIADVSKLANIQFFSQAEVGDILVAYSQANRAIIYRPATNTIVVSGPYTALNR